MSAANVNKAGDLREVAQRDAKGNGEGGIRTRGADYYAHAGLANHVMIP